jgi:2-amino-4-hydroxy-6-hydroxymethyldihydropteridine diphosphokinase
MQKHVFLGLGSNLNDRESYLTNAIACLNAHEEINVLSKSSMMQTDPVGAIAQPMFLNMVIEIETSLLPRRLLKVCLEIEVANGRVRAEKWGPRTLDIDMLFYGDAIIDEPGLCVPHPEVASRRFVLAPLAEIAPKFEHPVLREPVLAMLQLL